MRTWLWSLLWAVLLVAAAACAGGDGESAVEEETPAAPEETVAGTEGETEAGTEGEGVTVAVAASDLGDILVDGEGRTLYVFLNDEQGESVCYDECEGNWPPLTGMPEAGEGIDASLLGTVERDDGSGQATYGDWPLYYFAADSAPGDTNGQGVGEVWFVVGADGQPMQEMGAEAARY